MPVGLGIVVTHAPRWPIHESGLAVAHREVRIAGAADGDRPSGWYVLSRSGAAVLVVQRSGGSRARVADRVEMLARYGYGAPDGR
jgi:predicted NAD/FAD-dependent oxidoreductase